MQPLGGKPLVFYPCSWSFRIIGTHEQGLREIVGDVLGDCEYDLVRSNVSRTGKYVSLKLTLTVESEEHRLDVTKRLQERRAIRYLL